MSKIKINKLVKAGLSRNMVSQLSEREMDVLIQKFILNEQTTMVPARDQATIKKLKDQKKIFAVYEKEVTEDEEDPMNFEKGERTQDPHQVGPSSDDGLVITGMVWMKVK